MKVSADGAGCFPTGRHYPGIAHLLRVEAAGLADEYGPDHPMADLPMVAIDTETTGRDPTGDRVVEVGCVLWAKGAIVAQRSWLIDPGCPIPQDATEVHGIRDEDVSDKPPFAGIVAELLGVLAGYIPLAYNAEFDRAFLVAEFERAGVDPNNTPPAVRRAVDWIDPLVWAREIQSHEKGKALSDVCARLGIELKRAHRARDDAEAALQVMGSFLGELRVPNTYGAFIQEQRRLARAFAHERRRWRRASPGG
jgi:DNA polymerase-3 subunit epsilon